MVLETGVSTLDAMVVFVVGLLLGALGIYIGARVLADVEDYRYAIITALLGAIIWTVLGILIGWIPFIGPLIVLIAYVGVINWRYPGGWVQAIGIALVAWLAILVVLWILSTFGVTTPEAIGVPGI